MPAASAGCLTNGVRGAAHSRANPKPMETIMAPKLQQTPLPQPERHTATLAAKTTTVLEGTTVQPRTVQQIKAEQNKDKTDAVPKPAETLPAVAMPPPVFNPDLFQRNLAILAAVRLPTFSMNGNTGIYKFQNGSEIPVNSKFVVVMQEAKHGFIRFHGDGEKPDVHMQLIGAEPLIDRQSLSDNDSTKWENGKDPWQEQFEMPVFDASTGDTYCYLSRSKLCNSAARQFNGTYARNPRSKAGLLPVVQFGHGKDAQIPGVGTLPKPALTIVDWVNPDGTLISAQQKHDEFGDDVPF
jgi:hypothetical protein